MSFQSGLLGAALTLMGALSLSTPRVIQIHEVDAEQISVERRSIHFNDELLRTARSDSSRICRGSSTGRLEQATTAWASDHQFS